MTLFEKAGNGLKKIRTKLVQPKISFILLTDKKAEVNSIVPRIMRLKYFGRFAEVLVICQKNDNRTVIELSKIIIERNLRNCRVTPYDDSHSSNNSALVGFAKKVARSKRVIVLQNKDIANDSSAIKSFVQRLVGISERVKASKMIQFAAIGGSVFLIGMALLYALVEWANWSPLTANALQLIVTFWLNYQLNRRITWRERTISDSAAYKFVVSRAGTTVLNYALFALLVSVAVNYLVANVITLIAVTLLNYVFTDRWAFAEVAARRKKHTKAYNHHHASVSMYASLVMLLCIFFAMGFNPFVTLSVLLVVVCIFLLFQASIEVWRTIYSFRDPDSVERLRFPNQRGAKERFCLIVPARHESAVLASTLEKLCEQTHPNVHIITVICDDDYETLQVARQVALNEEKVSLVIYPLAANIKPSKPKQLNYVLQTIHDQDYTVIGVIDAEDTVHPELLMHIDSAFRTRRIGIVQGGVQLINHDSSWYSLHNVLEYYRWFNSSMAFQADNNFMPLGGNTVFVRAKLLKRAGGWPETLTEDCSLGVLLSTRFKTKTAVYYEPLLATQEETPDSLKGLFNQRVRWNQGFFHEWRKGLWRELPTVRQRLLADYVLFNPILLACINVLLPLSLVTAIFLQAPAGIVLLMYLPLIPAALLVVLNAVFLHDFGKDFNRKVLMRHYILLIATHFVYQWVLNAAAFWAVIRELRGDSTWYKTSHTGQHRTELAYSGAGSAASMTLIEEKANA